jgi:hypothetical protein
VRERDEFVAKPGPARPHAGTDRRP